MGEELDEHVLDCCPEMLRQSDTTAGPRSLFFVCMHTFPLTSLIVEYCLDQLEKWHFCEGNPPHSENALKLSP